MDFSKLAKQFDQAQKALARLNGTLTAVRFDPDQPASINAAIGKMEAEIDRCIAPYRNNALVKELTEDAKREFAQQIRACAAKARSDSGTRMDAMDTSIFRRIKNAVDDLKSADMHSFERHVKKLSQLLHHEDLEPFSTELAGLVNLQEWLSAGEATSGGMVGSAKLDWPSDPCEELGMTIALINYFAEDPKHAWQFSHTFYCIDKSTTVVMQHMTTQVIVPFARDFIEHVKKQTGADEPTQLPERAESSTQKVFVVHGHDDAVKEAVARFLEHIGLDAIILHEQASQGMTIIEKIEANGDVGYAVVLLTPDDIGGKEGDELQHRARQNVILELGYFIGRLGRERVIAFCRGDVEVPSDFKGVVYKPYDDNEGWKQALAKELKAAGFGIDLNKIK